MINTGPHGRFLHFCLLSLTTVTMDHVHYWGMLWLSFCLVFNRLSRKWKCFINLFYICLAGFPSKTNKQTQKKTNQILSLTTPNSEAFKAGSYLAHWSLLQNIGEFCELVFKLLVARNQPQWLIIPRKQARATKQVFFFSNTASVAGYHGCSAD